MRPAVLPASTSSVTSPRIGAWPPSSTNSGVRAALDVIRAMKTVAGAIVGAGTVLFLLGIGPLVQVALRRFALPPLAAPARR